MRKKIIHRLHSGTTNPRPPPDDAFSRRRPSPAGKSGDNVNTMWEIPVLSGHGIRRDHGSHPDIKRAGSERQHTFPGFSSALLLPFFRRKTSTAFMPAMLRTTLQSRNSRPALSAFFPAAYLFRHTLLLQYFLLNFKRAYHAINTDHDLFSDSQQGNIMSFLHG